MNPGEFKVPDATPQDLLLIQDIIGEPPPPSKLNAQVECTVDRDVEDLNGDSSTSSGGDSSDDESENEVVSDLLKAAANTDKRSIPPSDSDSDPDSDLESDRDIKENPVHGNKPPEADLYDDDDDTGTSLAPGAVPQTKNELLDTDINIPEVEEIGVDEKLARVGEVMTILDNKIVIVKGEASAIANKGSETALDSDTLLVFDDRKVLGYVYETFGPTSQPFYQVKFNQKYPLDETKVKPGREVYHIPTRSRFVFLRDIQHFRGSDASNLYDEEPAEHELDYSDDEAEAAAKSRRKRKRGESRAGSVASSRLSTPGPSQMHDQDLNYVSGDAYAAHGLYDIDFTAAPSRPLPMPYDDDPYADAPALKYDGETRTSSNRSPGHRYASQASSEDRASRPPRGRGRGRGRGDYSHRGRSDLGRNSRPIGLSTASTEPPIPGRTVSMTSPSAARWPSGQYGATPFAPYPSAAMDPSVAWGYHIPYNPSGASFQPYVQPHINPRFASMLGINTNFTAQTPFMGFGPGQGQGTMGLNVRDWREEPRSDWTDEWTVHGSNDSPNE